MARAFVLASAALLVPATAFAQPSSGAQPSAADLESARELFHTAKELRQKGDMRGALDRFKAAHAYGQTPVTALELGRTHMQLGELVEAREVLLSVARMKVQSDETDKSAAARVEAAELAQTIKPRIATVVVKLAGVTTDESAQLTMDGASVPVVSLGAVRRANPGNHVVVARANGREETRQIDLKDGETRELAIALDATGTSTSPAGEADRPSTSSRQISPVTWIGLGVGAVGLGIGTVSGVIALGKASDVESACDGLRCPPSTQETVDSGRSAATLSTIGFAVGAGGLLAAGIGYLFLSKPTSTASGPRIRPVFSGNAVGFDGVF